MLITRLVINLIMSEKTTNFTK